MKSYFTIFILTVMFLASTFTASSAQVSWIENPNNPILSPGLLGEWDDFSLAPACILFDGTTYHLWYGGNDGTYHRIGYATSLDGITWTPYSGNPVLDVGSAGSWEDLWVFKPYVIFDGSTYHMWYTGYDGNNARIGYATSIDKVTWIKHVDNPIINTGFPGSWNAWGVESPCVRFDGSIYHMWYDGWNGPNSFSIGYATSPDGLAWTPYLNNPIISAVPGEWDYPRVEAPEVFFDGNEYQMWYTGGSGLWAHRIGYATSQDGINWVKDTLNNPILSPGPNGSWDDQWVGFSRVLFDSTIYKYKMWFGGSDSDWNGNFGYATADTITGLFEEVGKLFPGQYKLHQNYPNPFNPRTTIEFSIPKSEFVMLKIYNLLGQEVASLVSEKLAAGKYKYDWDASGFASGVYVYKIYADLLFKREN